MDLLQSTIQNRRAKEPLQEYKLISMPMSLHLEDIPGGLHSMQEAIIHIEMEIKPC